MAAMLVRAMGFAPSSFTVGAHAAPDPMRYLDLARSKGLPVDNSCDMTALPFAMSECGELAKEDLLVCDQHACTPMMLAAVFMKHSQGSHSFSIDLGFEENEANLKHVTDQLYELIEFAERSFPGIIKYDESKLIEMQAYDEEARRFYMEMYEMRKHKPSPIAGKDAFGGGYQTLTAKGVEYARARRDEMAERIEKGQAGVPGEKLRILWAVTRPFFMDPFKVLAKRKAAVIYFYSGPSALVTPLPKPEYYNRRLSPLEKVAAVAAASMWGGTGRKWVDNMIWIARDLDVDAIVNYNMLGCTATLGLRKLVEEKAEKELGIPVLQLEGKQHDMTYANEATISAKLDEFIQMCLSRKGLA